MLGLGSSISRSGKVGPTIVRDGLVLKHGYAGGSVQPVSTGAASFNGTSDYIQLPDPFSYSKITVSAWIYLSEETSTASVIYESRDSGPDGFLFYVDTSEAIRIKAQDTSVAGTAGLPLNNWVHACFTYDSSAASSNIKLYENGVLVNTGSETDSVAITANAKLGGGVSTVSDYWFPGYICNAGVWDEVLTQPQIKSIMHKDYASLSASEKTNLVSWWNLDSTIPDVSTEVYDNHYGGGDELGSELIRNGDFSSDSGWTLSADAGNSTAEISGGTLNITVGAGDGYVYGMQTDGNMNAEYVSGSIYAMEATFTRTSGSGGRLRFQDNLSDTGGLTDALTQTELTGGEQSVKFYFKANSNSDTLAIARDNGASGLPVTVKVKSISLKLVNGNTGTLS